MAIEMHFLLSNGFRKCSDWETEDIWQEVATEKTGKSLGDKTGMLLLYDFNLSIKTTGITTDRRLMNQLQPFQYL